MRERLDVIGQNTEYIESKYKYNYKYIYKHIDNYIYSDIIEL